MKKIKLRKTEWEYDSSVTLGPPGGFGTVFLGRGEAGNEVAVKKLHISSASVGNRELNISEELEDKNYCHIIPFFDSGIDSETLEYFVVMAKADESLQQLVDNESMPENDAVKILTDIASGLSEAKDIVHRDLKPGNVLYHGNKWKLADFGIARFVENATSLNTLKSCLSPPYAAPEQWRLERAVKATDVYAFGCIAFALITGQPPFTSGDLRQCHLNEAPPRIPGSPKMQQLISLCLRKNHSARPSVVSVLKQLEGIATPISLSNSAIAVAGSAVATEQAKREAELSQKQTEEEARRELAKDAINSLDFILDMMFEAIKRDAPVAQHKQDREIELGNGILRVEIPFPFLTKEAFSTANQNIVCGAIISIKQNANHYRGRSANLWFGESETGEFRWHEISYFNFRGTKGGLEPFGMSKLSELKDANYAAGSGNHTVQHAATPKMIDGEYAEGFIKRWVTRLAEASSRGLQRPRHLPEG